MDNNDLVRLDTISQEYFNLKPTVARRKAALGTLPIPAFRLTNSGKGPFFVGKGTLAKLVEDRIAGATKLHTQMANA